jgi:hypothetical protein
MKEFRKNKIDFFVCEECDKTYKKLSNLSAHIGWKHNKENYVNKWIKENTDGICLNCKKPTKLVRWTRGFSLFCCRQCKNEYGVSENTKNKIKVSLKKTCLEKYGVTSFISTVQFKEKTRKIWIKNYGVENPMKSENIQEKVKQTNIKKYGATSQFNKKSILHKDYEKLMIKKYGCISPTQNKLIFEKQQKNSYLLKKFKNTILYYRGSYELDFLENYHNKFSDLINAPSIKYKFNNKDKIYFPDFYIPSLNLIIECKNSYLYKKDNFIILEKEKATIANGFKYFLILDKNYMEFNKYLSTISIRN